MNIIQKKLVESYAVLVMADRMKIEDVPEIKLIGGIDYGIRSEVEIEIANRTIAAMG
ncbi:CD1375 family protein [Sporosarcina sp. D27]|uniref:CD1375 family protein n=1 Tax=Sporosarcina sp. D27 TaxID=1382305 RepID=UPI0004BC918B|nr:CD1375 family protein [Sporosarcina sp. D27]